MLMKFKAIESQKTNIAIETYYKSFIVKFIIKTMNIFKFFYLTFVIL